MAMLTAAYAAAFPVDRYADTSALATGHWVKVSVPENGLYALTPAQLRQWGFSGQADRIRVCGYGATAIPDQMTTSNYIDDLPAIPTFVTPGGNVVFYGAGPETWATATSGRYSKTNNLYTTQGYYFITEIASGDSTLSAPEVPVVGLPEATQPERSFWQRLQHEKELYSPGQAGPQLVGENFKYNTSQTFTFDLPGRIDNDETGIWFEVSFVAKTYGQASTLNFTANGQSVPTLSADRIPSTINDLHYHGSEGVTRHTLPELDGNRLTLGITHTSPVAVENAWLNYISVNYQRKLEMAANGYLMFWSNRKEFALAGAKEGSVILDVTTPSTIYRMDAGAVTSDGTRRWTTNFTGWRTYVAFNPDAALPAPAYVGTVANQDLHGTITAMAGNVPDMVIVAPRQLMAQAQRIVRLHTTDPVEPLDVRVYCADDIYNEFSSGSPNPAGLRKFFKMIWDNGKDLAPQGYESKFRYALLMGRATFDNRHLCDNTRNFTSFTIPNWTAGNMRQSLNDTDGYNTDDFMTLLKDNSGNDMGLNDLCIALGRIPARSTTEANMYIDKLEQYMRSSKKTGWKTSAMFLADDGDLGRHMDQTESQIKNMQAIPGNPLMANKVYIDAYTRESGVYPLARDAMFRFLDEGVVWWNYIGHANDHALTHNGQLTYTDLNNMLYKHLPVFYAATCDFLRWDQNSVSGGELMFFERYGGAIAVISATRPVYIYENGLLNNAVGRHLGARDADGRLLTVGEIYRRSKNNILTDAGAHLTNPNRLKFVLMGDPAMRMSCPSDIAVISDIDGKPLEDLDTTDNPMELHALQTATVNGYITTPDGSVRTDFNGVVTATLYDAQYSTTTNGYPDNNTEGKKVTFERQGSRLSASSAQVKDGKFSVNITVPMDIADNYRPAAISLYAYADHGTDEAAGLEENLYVYGYDTTSAPDTIRPEIEAIYLNHNSFVDGDMTNTSPLLIARVSDNVAINLSNSGIGHSMVAQLDGKQTFTDVSLYYTPATDGTPGGTINYPLTDLMPGPHALTLRVWDTSANSTTATVNFNVGERVAPKIYDIYTDTNPAVDRANFYITHDRPEQMLSVTVEVYNLLGHPLWSKTVSGISDMFTSTPVQWDLTDNSGRRVSRGIYLYRATITADGGQTFDTGSRRIAVAAQ